MKFISVNKLSDFEFHDTELNFNKFSNNSLQLKARHLNIRQNAEQNPHETDMEIATAIITFEDFSLSSYEISKGENSKTVLTDFPAFSLFKEQLKSGITVFDFGIYEGNTYFIDATEFFTVFFTFKNLKIEWDEYKGKAWYVSR